MSVRLGGTLNVEMLSDWHVGTGAGRPGDLDRLVARDTDNVPYIPAKTLIGMWRDSCERIACGLDGGTPKADGWSGWVDEIFGDEPTRRPPGSAAAAPAEAALSLRPARLPAALRERLRPLGKGAADDERQRRERLRGGLTFAKPGVKIDAWTGRAQDDFLRMEEMARAGVTLAAPFEVRATSRSGAEWTATERAAIEALLVAGASEIERLGGKRRRGTGRCCGTVAGLAPLDAALVARFDDVPPARPKAPDPESQPAAKLTPLRSGGWCALPIRLELLTPVVAADATVGNVVESLDYIPGSLLLPVVARALSAVGVDASAEIAAGNVIVLPATVEIDGQRGLPVPYALHMPKDEQGLGRAHNRLIEPEADGPDDVLQGDGRTPNKAHNRQAKRAGYVVSVRAGEKIPYKTIDRVVATHSTIAEEEQRPTETVGGVFSYQAIPAGNWLRSEIRLRSQLAERLPADFGEVRLGRSKKDDYGLVRVSAAGEWENAVKPDAARIKATGGEQELRLWVQSDLLLRDDGLRPTNALDALRQVLAQAFWSEPVSAAADDRYRRLYLGVPNERCNPEKTLLGADLRVRRYDGWQAQWGLPRPSLVGVSAGSCLRIVLAAGHAVDADRIAEIEVAGLGERRAEGFGQVRFEDPLLTEKSAGRPVWEKADADASSFDPIPEGAPEHEAAAVIERAAWRRAITEAATRLAHNKDCRTAVFGFAKRKPGPSQLGALRSLISGLRAPAPVGSPVRDWLKGVKERRADKWPSGSLALIEKLLTERAPVWAALGVHEMVESLTEDCRERLERELWGEAVIAAIGGAIRAHIFAVRREEIGDSPDA